MRIFRWHSWTWAMVVLIVGGANCLAQVDTDGDGFTDQQEKFLGTNPNDASSYPGALTNGFSGATNLIYVAKTGSDTNSGSAAAPFLTIQKAATTAKTKSAAGIGSTITIMPGSYGETILYKADGGDLVAPVVFTAATNGTVIITGADVWTNNWTQVSGNIYKHTWTNTWGYAAIPSGWPKQTTNNFNVARRGEIVLVNGNLYFQVPSQAALTNGSYFVDETNQLLYVQHRAGVMESSAFYEVTQRTNLMTITRNNNIRVGNIKLEGLEFRMAADQLPNPAVQIAGATNVLVDTCLFDWNNWVGINFDYGTNITIRNSVGSHNGAMGMQMGNTEFNIVVDSCETDYNNWRGFPSDFTGFSIAGIKLLKIHKGLVRNHVAVGNQTYGLWFDFDNKSNFVDGCTYDGNFLSGLQFEASEGPVWIQNCVSTRGYGSEAQSGLLLQNTENLTVTNCAIFSSLNPNGPGAIGCSVTNDRVVTNWENSAIVYDLFSSHWDLKDNLLRFGGRFQLGIFMATNFTGFVTNLTSDYNHFCNFFTYTNMFTLNGVLGGTAEAKTNLTQWQMLTGQDTHSESNDLSTANTVIQDTYILPGSSTSHGTETNAICDTAPDGAGALNNIILLKFDISGMTNIPREAELRMTGINFDSTNAPIFGVYRMTTDWDENATGTQAKPGSGTGWKSGNFSTSDFDPTPVRFGLCITNVINFGTFNTWVDVTPLAQGWAAGTVSNFGVALIAEPTWDQPVIDGSNYKRFQILTHDTTLTNIWPVLVSQGRGMGPSNGCPPIVLMPATLSDGMVSNAYSALITASGSTATPITFTNIGALPSGLTLTPQGTLSGTPTVTGTSGFTIQATDTNHCPGSQVYSLTITGGCPIITVSPSSLPPGVVSWVYTGAVTAANGASPYTFLNTAGTMPSGVLLSSQGTFTGRPTGAGTFTFTVQATDNNGCKGSNLCTIVVSATGVCPPITLSPTTLPTGTINSSYASQTFIANGANGLSSFTNSSGSLPPGLVLSSAGVLSGTPTATGSYPFTVKATDTNNCTGSTNYTVVVVCPTITLSPGILATGTVNVLYNTLTITASNGTGPYTFTNTVGTLPNGLTLFPGGTISGTPTVAVTNSITIQATDSDGCTGNNNYTLVIKPPCPTITFTPATLPTGTVGTAYSQAITATNGAIPYMYTNTVGTLPSGLTLSSAGILSGVPTTDGTNTFTVQATDSNGCPGTVSYTLVTKLGVGAVFLNFNTGTTDFTGNFNSNGGVFTWTSTAGITNSGGVKVSTTDETAIYRSNRWNLSTNGASITLSSFIRSTNSGASVQNALGVSTVTNGQFKTAAAGGWLTFYLNTQSGFTQARIGYQYQTNGVASTNVNLGPSFSLLQTNWYKWSVTFLNTNGVGGLGTGNVTLDNYGAKGTGFVGNVFMTNGVSFNNVAQSVFKSATNYPGIRAWSSSGLGAFDNWSVSAP